MMKTTKTVNEILSELNFSEELKTLRKIILSAGLEETIKWGGPVYTFNGKNIVGISGFKEHFSLWFYQGALLRDKQKKLINAQEGKTKALRQWRMTSKTDIDKPLLITYLKEAIDNEKKGLRIAGDKPIKTPPALPPELQAALNGSKKLKAAFEKFTPGKQKEFAEFITSVKQAQTKATRLLKIKPMILAGVGLNEIYSKK
jgi:uncharacterized protein YdeI (YjbR/CyaY-like superfamily)